MSKPISGNSSQETVHIASDAHPDSSPIADRCTANEEMARVLQTQPLRIALESSGAIAHWQHDPVHDIVKPMADHVVMTYPVGVQRLERRTGRSVATGTARPGVVTVIPAGSSARWDVTPAGSTGRPGIQPPLSLIQLYLPHTTLARVASEADTTPRDLLERIAYPDPITSRLLTSAADVLEGNMTLDALFRQRLTDLLATRLLAAHTGSPMTFQAAAGGLSPKVLLRAIERLRSDGDTDVSLDALASDAGLSRFHFCRAFKESTGLSPHAWLRQHRHAQAMTMLRDTDESIVQIAAALGYSSQTAFAAAFRKMSGETPRDFRRHMR